MDSRFHERGDPRVVKAASLIRFIEKFLFLCDVFYLLPSSLLWKIFPHSVDCYTLYKLCAFSVKMCIPCVHSP